MKYHCPKCDLRMNVGGRCPVCGCQMVENGLHPIFAEILQQMTRRESHERCY